MELIPRFHQELFVYKTLQKIKEGKKNFLYGWKCRAGKTYGVGHLIDTFYKEFEHINALIITPAPSETLSQFGHEMFDAFINFKELNIVEIKKGSQLNELRINQNNVYIISKQLLDNYVKSDKKSNFHKQLFDLIICDENHFGGTTHKAEQIFKLFSSSDTHFIFLSATYQKTLLKFNIDKDCQFYWNIEDEHFCKNRQLDKLIYKHDKDVNLFLNNTNIDDKLQFYDNMPELHLLSTLLDSDKFKSIKKKLMDNNDNEQGFSMDVLFSLKENKQELEFKEYVKQLFQYICGTDKHCIYERIKSLSIRNKSRTLLNNDHFTTQLWFLPFGIGLKIDDLSQCIRQLMNEFDEFNQYEIMIINSKMKKLKSLKESIFDTEIEVKEKGKKGLILLAGNQCSLGITLPLVDIVFLLNNITSCDKIMQMMYRCMSESKTGYKKLGFVVDFNINRVLHTFIDYPVSYDKQLNSGQKIEYMIENKLIHLDEDIFESKENRGKLINTLLNIWKNEPDNEVQLLMKKIKHSSIDLNDKDQYILNQTFSSLGNCIDGHFVKFDDEIHQSLPKGRIHTPLIEAIETKEKQDIDEEDDLNDISFEQDILPFVLPLLGLMNCEIDEHQDFESMSTYVNNNEELCNVMNDYCEHVWDKKNLFQITHLLGMKYLKTNLDINNILLQFKMVSKSLINKPNELHDYLKKSLKPKELEKKKFGEVFTPMELIDEMMDKLDYYYKKDHKKSIFSDPSLKWYDPAGGMGSFPVNVFYRLDKGLKKNIPNDEKRKKHILENMLYMSEINKKNCYILNKVLNASKYKLNIYCGDSFKVDVFKKFNIDSFDVIMGNPPFSSDSKKATGKTIWQEFVIKSIAELSKNGYLTFIHPSQWRKPESEQSRFGGIFDLMTHQHQLLYLEMHNTKNGQHVFQSGTRYDWYILENKKASKKTDIIDDKYKKISLNLNEWDFLPNNNHELIKKLLKKENEEPVKIIKNSKYYTLAKHTSTKKQGDFKYPLVHSTPKSGVRYYYSNTKDKGHFKIPKIIFGESGISEVIIDLDGKYGMTESAMAIEVKNESEAKKLKKVLESNEFQDILNACSWSNFRIDWRLFAYMKNDFYKYINH